MNIMIAVNALNAGERVTVLPAWWKFLLLLAVVVELMAAGFFLKRKWLQAHDVLPLPGALSMWFAMSALYMLVASALYWSSGRAERGPILFWLFVFFVPLSIQYARNIAHSLSGFFVQRLSPMGAHIPEAPSVGMARRSLLQGNIEEALQLFMEALGARQNALAEAARLLKSEERYEDAVPLYMELIERYREDRLIWSEAVYNLGKLFETHLNAPRQAAILYRQLIDEAPDSRFCHLAGADLARLQVMDEDFVKTLQEDDDYIADQDPFHARRLGLLKTKDKPAPKKTSAAKTTTKRAATKKSVARKTTARKTSAPKTVVKKKPVKKPAVKKKTGGASPKKNSDANDSP